MSKKAKSKHVHFPHTPRPKIVDLFSEALQYHQEGALAEAESLYRRVLEQNPQHADALHLLGVIAQQAGQQDIAITCIRKAIAIRATEAAFHNNLANALQASGDIEAAIAAYQDALRLKPEYVEANFNLGNIRKDQGDLGSARDHYGRVLSVKPDHVETHNNLGSVCEAQGDLDAAALHFQTALHLRPDYAIAHNNLGNCLRISGDFAAAFACFREALRLDPDNAEAHRNLGVTFKETGDLDSARCCFLEALRLDSGYAEAHNDLGIVLHAQGNSEEAAIHFQLALGAGLAASGSAEIFQNLGDWWRDRGELNAAVDCYRTALALRPDFAEVHNNLGSVLQALDRLDEAHACYQEAERLNPELAETHANLGVTHLYARDLVRSVDSYQRALALKPELPEAHMNLSLVYLAQGNLAEGWQEYQWRWRMKNRPPRSFSFPEWDGSSLEGKTVLVYAEQGVGDEILFASCLPDVIQQAKQVVIECDPRLAPLYARAFPQAQVFGAGREDTSWVADTPAIDVQVAIGELPRFLRQELAQFPTEAGYLQAEPTQTAAWRERLACLGSGLKVGISWRSMLRGADRNRHYTSLEQWGALFALPGIEWVNLQYDQCAEELAQAEQQFGVKIYSFSELNLKDDLEGAAALTSALDLVIAPSNSVFALAGSLGIPVWLLTVYEGSPDSLGTERFPWFPSARVRKQTRQGEWQTTLQNVAREIGTIAEICFEPSASDVFSLALARHQQGRYSEAEALYLRVIELDPSHAPALHLLGVLAHQAGRNDAAIERIESAIAIKDDDPAFFSNLGVTFMATGDIDRAISAFQQALRLKPYFAEAHNNLGNCFRDRAEYEAAVGCYQEALRLKPEYQEAHNNLGTVFHTLNKNREALACFAEALRLKPDYLEARNNLGAALEAAGDAETALANYREALRLNPDYVEAHVNLALALSRQADFESAVAANRKALELRPDYAEAHMNLSLVYLAQGNLAEGWQEYQWRWRMKNRPPRSFSFPEWDGSSLEGKTVLVYAEQGVGDEILFASCLPDVIQQAKQVVIECDPRLAPLYRRAFPQAQVVGAAREDTSWVADTPAIDVQVAIGELPRFLRQELAQFPAQAGYLQAEPTQTAAWQQRLSSLGSGLKVGISWRSMLRGADRNRHYTSLEQWGALFALPGIEWVNLQYDQCAEELAQAEQQFGVKIYSFSELNLKDDLEGAAALTSALDLVIAPSNSVFALAGSLGIPVWLLTVYEGSPDSLGTERFPWFPSAQVRKQTRQGEWEFTLQGIADSLQELTVVDTSSSNTRGVVLAAKGDWEGAMSLFQQVLQADPQHTEANNNMGWLLQANGGLDAAAHHVEQALQVRPDFPEALCNLGVIRHAQGRLDAAIAAFERAIQLRPDFADAHFKLSLVLLTQGDFARGWAEHEWRLRTAQPTARAFAQPLWDGSPLAGKTILVHAEQGFGDTFQFLRYLPLVQAQGGTVLFECQPGLRNLLEHARGFDRIFEANDDGGVPHAFDVQIPLMSLPAVFGTRQDTIPAGISYLQAEPGRIDRWRTRLAEAGDTFKIGIVWAGNPDHANDRNRSCSFADFAPLTRIGGLALFSLQKGVAAAEITSDVPVVALSDELADFADTAAVISCLDLVITVDTAVAHLAGALGKAVWTLLPFVPEWRWQCDRADSPWYPTMRLFRQARPGDWTSVFENIVSTICGEPASAPAPAVSEAELARLIAPVFAQALEYHQTGRLAEAEVLYRKIVECDPRHADALHLLGLLAHQTGQHEAAEGLIRAAIAVRGTEAPYYSNLGLVLEVRGDLDGAIAAFEQAIRLHPKYTEAYNNLGVVLRKAGRLDDAIAAYRQALRLTPQDAEIHTNLGNCWREKGKLEEAVACYRKALKIQPGFAAAHNGLGSCWRDKNDLEAAITCYQEAIRLKPGYVEAHNNLGIALQALDLVDDSLACFATAVQLKPDFTEGYVNLGLSLLRKGDIDAAVHAYHQALALNPDFAETHINLSLAYLMQGRLADGWQELGWRWRTRDRAPRAFPYPEWDGSSLEGKTVLVYAEQGVGDEILFASCLPEVIRQAKQVVIECEVRLAPLYRRAFPDALIFGATREDTSWLSAAPPIDVQVAIGELPRFLRQELSAFPTEAGYLHAEPTQTAAWEQRLACLGSGLKVGISWRSMLRGAERNRYYTRLEQWAPLFAIPGIVWVNLQYDQCTEELAQAEQQFGVKIHSFPELNLKDDLDAAAALTSALDLVIAPSNSVFALAGALGVPTWLLTVFEGAAESLGTDDFPWFPAVRLVRQSRPGDWEDVLQRAARTLGDVVADQDRQAERQQVIAGVFSQAAQYHNAGKLGEAEMLYRKILEADPRHAGALQLLGVLAYRMGQNDVATKLVHAAMTLRDSAEPFYAR